MSYKKNDQKNPSLNNGCKVQDSKEYDSEINFYELGIKNLSQSKIEDAIRCFKKAIEISESFEALHDLGLALAMQGKYNESILYFEKAAEQGVESWELHYNLANAYEKVGNKVNALTHYDLAIKINAGCEIAYLNKGICLREVGSLKESLSCYNRALELNGANEEVLSSKGNVLIDLNRMEEALLAFKEALKINPSHAETWSNLARLMYQIKDYQQAIKACKNAININPNLPNPWFNLGLSYQKIKDYGQAIVAYQMVKKIDANWKYIDGIILHNKMIICAWDDFDRSLDCINRAIGAGKKVAEPFGYYGLSENNKLLLKCSKIYAEDVYPQRAVLSDPKRKQQNDKIKIGYLGGEFRKHATSILMAEIFELHSKDEFEIYIFDNSVDDGSEYRRRIFNASDHVIEIQRLSDEAAANLIQNLQIDILLNLNGYFGDGRMGVFSYKPAPIQINYLGFPGTLGASYMDYIIADKVVIPDGEAQYYSEKILYLPVSYQANDRKRKISDKKFTRSEIGLPENGMVYCCFNHTYKITPYIFDAWMNILKAVPDSVLWLLETSKEASKNLTNEAKKRGVSMEKIIFSPVIDFEDHLSRHQLADLFLDTLPYNAHTTASDALWTGLPVLSCAGNCFAGRVGKSLLQAVNLEEFIVEDIKDYEKLAIELGRNKERIAFARKRLENNKKTYKLFDSVNYTKNLESIFRELVQ